MTSVTAQTPNAPRVLLRLLAAAIALMLLGGVAGVATIEEREVVAAGPGMSSVLASVNTTIKQPSSRVTIDVATSVGGTTRDGTRALEGVVDFESGRGTAFITAAGGTLKVVNDGTTTYVQFPPGWPLVSEGKWIAVANDLPGVSNPDRSTPFGGTVGPNLNTQAAPRGLLEVLKQEGIATGAVVTGRADVRGVATTVHRVTLDQRRFTEWVYGAQAARGPQFVPEVDLFVDDDGLVRRQVVRLAAGVGQGEFAVLMTAEYWDFGVPVEAQPPPPADVVRINSAAELERLLRAAP